MKWYQKYWTAVGIFMVVYIPTVITVQKRINDSIQPYVESHLERIIENQEEKIGIKHFGVPKISYEHPPWVRSAFQAMGIPGCYELEKDEIYLPLGLAITPDKNLTNTLATCITFGDAHNVKPTIDHELGHFYCDKLSESLGRGNWPTYHLEKPDPYENFELIGTKLVAEGIAEYFEQTMNDGQDNFQDSDWPEITKDFWEQSVIYDGGFHLVKPIIDKHGKKGIEYLILNPPSVKDLDDLPAYQNRALQSLSER